ncbi:MAG: hypothetical protein ACWGQW_20840, partial [bacterium]
ETPNTHIAIFDYQSAPIIQEVRGLGRRTDDSFVDAFTATGSTGVVFKAGRESEQPSQGVVIECEDGWVDTGRATAYDNSGKSIMVFEGGDGEKHELNFIQAIRNRRRQDFHFTFTFGQHVPQSRRHYSVGRNNRNYSRKPRPERIFWQVSGTFGCQPYRFRPNTCDAGSLARI